MQLKGKKANCLLHLPLVNSAYSRQSLVAAEAVTSASHSSSVRSSSADSSHHASPSVATSSTLPSSSQLAQPPIGMLPRCSAVVTVPLADSDNCQQSLIAAEAVASASHSSGIRSLSADTICHSSSAIAMSSTPPSSSRLVQSRNTVLPRRPAVVTVPPADSGYCQQSPVACQWSPFAAEAVASASQSSSVSSLMADPNRHARPSVAVLSTTGVSGQRLQSQMGMF